MQVLEFFTITVITTGEDLEDRFRAKIPLRVVFQRALAAIGGGSNRDNFTLEFQDQPLNLGWTIGQAAAEFGWDCAVTLELVPRPEVISGV